jgi:hypothetical protein
MCTPTGSDSGRTMIGIGEGVRVGSGVTVGRFRGVGAAVE